MKIQGITDATTATKLALQNPNDSIVPYASEPQVEGDDLACTDINWTIGAPYSLFHVLTQSGFTALFGIRIGFVSGQSVHVESEASLTDSSGVKLGFSGTLRGTREIIIPPDDLTPWIVPGAGGLKGWPDPGPGGSGIVKVTLYGMETAP